MPPKKTVKRAPATKAGDACSDEKPCNNPFICNNRTKKCVRARTDEAKALVKDVFRKDPPKLKRRERPVKRERKPWDPAMTQGAVGFNEYATKHMRAAGLDVSTLACPVPGSGFKPQPYQVVPGYLLHPELPIDRMLLAHRTGTGKTYTLILILDNYFNDPRSKVAIFPNDTVADNFYGEILKFPSRYREFVERVTGIVHRDLMSKRDPVSGEEKPDPTALKRVKDALGLVGKLSLAGTPGYPAAPLRSLRYTKAGGAEAFGESMNPLFKRNYDGKNPYSNMIVVMDEFHNLNDPEPDVMQYLDKLKKLRSALMSAENSVIVGATATPIVKEVDDAKRNIAILRGAKYEKAPTNEGFVSFYQDLSERVFARVLPNGPPPANFPRIVSVEMQGDNLDAYNKKEKEWSKKIVNDEGKLMAKIHGYSSFSMYMTTPVKPKDKFYQALAKNAASAATKLDAIVRYVREHPKGKVLIILHRHSGFKALKALWEINYRADQCDPTCKQKCPKACWMTMDQEDKTEKEKAANLGELAKFNKSENKTGDEIRVAIVNAQFYESGVSFYGVRHLLLVDVPMKWSGWMQRMGRALRFCGHNNLPPEDRTVDIVMFVAHRADDPSGKHRPTSDQYFVKKLRDDNDELVRGLMELETTSVDRAMLESIVEARKKQEEPPKKTSKQRTFDDVELATMYLGMKL